jgi:2-polyprenyl-3-methyl-5-hydroxy-6-metoxy-1,4-benzoquinol methylase
MSDLEKKYSDFLCSLKGVSSGFINRLKIRYRPFICPFEGIVDEAKKANSVFDIGCGNGQLLYIISEFSNSQNKKLTGIEISDNLITQAAAILNKNRFTNIIEVYKYDGITIPDEINDYDLITMVDVLHHVPKNIQKNILDQLFRKMKPGSRFLLKDIDAGSPLVYFNKIHDLVLSKEIGNEISFVDARTSLESLGFKVLKAFKKRTFWYPHYFILLEKPQ